MADYVFRGPRPMVVPVGMHAHPDRRSHPGKKAHSLSDAELSAVKTGIAALVAKGVPADEARRQAVRALLSVKRKGRGHAYGLHRRMAEGGLSGLSGLVVSTQDFNKLNAAQNHAIAIQSEISGIGQDVWDSAIDSYGDAVASAGWSPASDYSFEKMMAFWLAQTKRLLVYGDAWVEHRPTTEDVSEVENFAQGTDRLIALIRNYIPSDAADAGAADRAETEAALAHSALKSPDDAAAAAFKEELLKRANALASGIGTTTILGIAAAVALAIGLGFMGSRK